MLTIVFLILITLVISSVILLLAISVSKKSLMEREKLSPFECGFDPKSKARAPFSLRFFLLTVIFLIFDIEIAIILPLGLTFSWNNLTTLTFSTIFIVLILIAGLLHEWKQGALNWLK